MDKIDKNSPAAAWFRNLYPNVLVGKGKVSSKPAAIVVVSAHWESFVIKVTSSARPGLVYGEGFFFVKQEIFVV